MKVERIEFSVRGPNETTKRMRRFRDQIPLAADGSVEQETKERCRYFGERFGIGGDI